MWIIQIADLHNCEKYKSANINKISKEMIFAINNTIQQDELIVWAICGDILNQGVESGYNHAKDFLENIQKKINTNNYKYILCPGNHDIATKDGVKGFYDFDKFTFKLTSNSDITYSDNSCNIVSISHIDFILINSSYHKDHSYGEVDLEKFNNIIQCSKNKNKIIVIHHHLIPTKDDKKSSIINAYEFFQNVEKNNVLAILHGHQHMKMKMTMGSNLCDVIGVGSILTEIGTNYNNQFNMIEICDDKINHLIEFKYHSDEMGQGSLGKFISTISK